MSTPTVYKYELKVQDRHTGEIRIIKRLSIYGRQQCLDIFRRFHGRMMSVRYIFRLKGTY